MKTTQRVGLFVVLLTVGGTMAVPTHAANLDEGLVAYYPFNGNANDESGNGNNGTIMGGCGLVADRAGNLDQAYDFDGTSGYIVCGNSTAFDVNEHTISAWIRADAESPHISSILGKGYPYNYEAICFAVMSNRMGTLFASGTEANNVIYGEKVLNTQTWYHVAMTYDGDQVRFYCDGQIDREIPRTGAVRVSTNLLALGRRSGDLNQIGDEHYFNGILDDIRIYNRALASNEVLQLYHLGDVDSDGDGLPDWWEEQYFGDLSQGAGGDPDGDGSSNLVDLPQFTVPIFMRVSCLVQGQSEGAGAHQPRSLPAGLSRGPAAGIPGCYAA